MEKKIFIKLNKSRKKIFQTETSIIQTENKRYVMKRALTAEAVPFLRDAYENAIIFVDSIKNIKIPSMEYLNGVIKMELVDGNTWESILIEYLKMKDIKGFKKSVDEYYSILQNMRNNKIPFEMKDGFRRVFGVDLLIDRSQSYEMTNIDMSFDNIIIDKDGCFYLIDLEWLFDFPIPIDFILFRALTNLRIKHSTLFNRDLFNALIEKYGVTEKIDTYEKMETSFQKFVCGDNGEVLNQYAKRTINDDKFQNIYEKYTNRIKCLEEKTDTLENKKNELFFDLQQQKSINNILIREKENIDLDLQEQKSINKMLIHEKDNINVLYLEMINSRIWKTTRFIRLIADIFRK